MSPTPEAGRCEHGEVDHGSRLDRVAAEVPEQVAHHHRRRTPRARPRGTGRTTFADRDPRTGSATARRRGGRRSTVRGSPQPLPGCATSVVGRRTLATTGTIRIVTDRVCTGVRPPRTSTMSLRLSPTSLGGLAQGGVYRPVVGGIDHSPGNTTSPGWLRISMGRRVMMRCSTPSDS